MTDLAIDLVTEISIATLAIKLVTDIYIYINYKLVTDVVTRISVFILVTDLSVTNTKGGY